MMRFIAIGLFCLSALFFAQAYILAFHGTYIFCYAPSSNVLKNCVRSVGEPSILSVFLGLCFACGGVFAARLGIKAFRKTSSRARGPRGNDAA